jgi:uracil permease
MLFVAFGALVLVPLLTGLDPNVALFTAGLGTLVFQVITKVETRTGSGLRYCRYY